MTTQNGPAGQSSTPLANAVGTTPSGSPGSSLWSVALSALPEKDRQIFKIATSPPPDAAAILKDIVAALEKQRDRCKRDKWTTISIGGRELIIRDICAKIATHVKKFLAVVDVAVSFDPVHAALPWAGVRFLLQLTFNGFETFGAIIEGLEKATRLIAQCGILETLITRHGSGPTDAKVGIEEEIVKLYAAVLDFFCKAKKHCDDSSLKRALNLTTKQRLQDSVKEMAAAEERVLVMKGLVDSERVEEIHDGIATIALAVNSTGHGVDDLQKRLSAAFDDIQKPLVRITDAVSDLHNALQENERSALLMWLSTVPVQQHYREALSDVLPDSGEWLLKDPRFISWRDSSSSETFWLHGIPGCGKTKLAAIVIQHLNQNSSGASQPAPIAHFFCSRNPAESSRGDSHEILRSLTKHVALIRDKASLKRPLVDAYQTKREDANQTGERPALLAMEECVEAICEIGRTTPFTIIIDALDECTSTHRRILLDALEEIRQRCRDVVKIFVSSRNEEDIRAYLKSGEVLEIKSSRNEEDLKRFIQVGTLSFVKRWSKVHDEPVATLQKLESQITKTLAAGAKGMFLWVSLQLEAISDTERIKDVGSVLQALSSLPPTLSKSYEFIQMRIQSMGEEPRRIAMHTLHWLLHAERQLSVSELLAAVGKTPDSSSEIAAKSLLDFCCNLVVMDEMADTFRLAHLSVRELVLPTSKLAYFIADFACKRFLEASDGYSFYESNFVLAQRCLGTYLWGECDQDDLLIYATRHWPAHVESLQGSSQRTSIKHLVVDFFTKEEHFEDWLEELDKRSIDEDSSWNNPRERKIEACFSSPPSGLFAISCFGLIEVLESTTLPQRLMSTSSIEMILHVYIWLLVGVILR